MKPTPEQLQAYWESNPQALTAAMEANPAAFGLSVEDPYENITRGGQALEPLPVSGLLQAQIGEDLRYEGTTADQKLYTSSPAAQPKYNYADTQQMAQQILSSGASLVDGSKYYDTGNPALNEALYGPDISLNLSAQGAGWRTPRGMDTNYTFEGLKALIAAAPAIATGGASLAAQAGAGAAGGLMSGAMNDLSGTDLLEATLTGGVSGAAGGLIEQIPVFGDAYSAQNFGGAFIEGTTDDLVAQALSGESVDFGDALRAGGINMGVETALDVLGDARQTNDGNLVAGVNMLNGDPMIPDDVTRLTNSSDIYGLLGENGFLGQLGLETSNLRTDWLGDTLDFADNLTGDFFDFGGSPIFDETEHNHIEDLRAYRAGTLRPGDTGYEAALLADEFARNADRYDERFFDLFTPRGESTASGIYEQNPVGSTGLFGIGALGVGGNSGSSSLPSAPSAPRVSTDNQAPSSPDTPIISALFPEFDVGTSAPPPPQELPTSPSQELPAPQEMAPTSIGIPFELTAIEDELPPELGGDTDDDLPSINLPEEGELPPPPAIVDNEEFVAEGDEEEEIPEELASGGSGGGSGSGDVVGAGKAEWEDFMAVPDFQWELMKRLQVTPKDYLAALMQARGMS